MKTSRRAFLKHSGHALAGYAAYSMLQPSGVAFASGFCSQVPIVELHLSGEAPDHLLLCPSQASAAWSSYAANNPSILPTLPVPGVTGSRALLPIDGHPNYALRSSLTAFQRAINNVNPAKYSLAAVNYVGHSTNRDFGHDTSWTRVSVADVGPNSLSTPYGWAGKLADQCYATDPLAVFSLRGRTLTAEGVQSKVNIVSDLAFGFNTPRGGPAYSQFISEAFRKTRKADPVLSNISDKALQSAWDTLDFSAGKMAEVVAKYNAIPAAQRATYATDGLSQGFLNAARLIRSGQLEQGSIHLAQGGWDVHESALERIEKLTTTLNGAVGAFISDMELGGKDVILLIWHAFGRNTFENANTALSMGGQTISVPGCDHGHGRTAWVFRLGSKIRRGVHGPTGYRADDFLNPKRVTGALGWMPGGDVTRDRGIDVPGVDFREVLSQVLQQAGADPADIIPGAFPKSSYGLQIFR
jgi:uncharacterized protein (DUF1501 family)